MGLALPMQWGHWQPPNLGFLAWVALVPLIIATDGLRPRRAYAVAFPGMMLGHAIMVYWFYTAVHEFGHLSAPVSVVVTLLGILFLAAITSLAPMLVAWIQRWRNYWWAWPLCWAAIELGRNFDPFLQGFTFCNLIHSQYRYPLLFQIVNLVGPYWFLAIIAGVNVLIVRWWRSRSWVPAAAIATVMAVLLGYGAYSRHQYRVATPLWPMLRVALIQGNIPQEDKWNADMSQKNFAVYQKASVEAASAAPDLIIWPEASFPWAYDLRTQEFPLNHGLPPIPLLMGTIGREGEVIHNSAVLLDAQARFSDVVHKYHLVPFGEYIP
jgi:apolipoprotein N-acyltransferase